MSDDHRQVVAEGFRLFEVVKVTRMEKVKHTDGENALHTTTVCGLCCCFMRMTVGSDAQRRHDVRPLEERDTVGLRPSSRVGDR